MSLLEKSYEFIRMRARTARLIVGHIKCRPLKARVPARTFRSAIAVSALHPKADMCSATSDVRYVPKADILFDYLIGARKQRRRHIKTEHSRCLSVDDQFEFNRLNDRQS